MEIKNSSIEGWKRQIETLSINIEKTNEQMKIYNKFFEDKNAPDMNMFDTSLLCDLEDVKTVPFLEQLTLNSLFFNGGYFLSQLGYNCLEGKKLLKKSIGLTKRYVNDNLFEISLQVFFQINKKTISLNIDIENFRESKLVNVENEFYSSEKNKTKELCYNISIEELKIEISE